MRRRYIKELKLLRERDTICLPLTAVRGIPPEVLRMLRLKYGIAFAITPRDVFFWHIGKRAARLLAPLEEFSGRYTVGRDAVGFFWEETEGEEGNA